MIHIKVLSKGVARIFGAAVILLFGAKFLDIIVGEVGLYILFIVPFVFATVVVIIDECKRAQKLLDRVLIVVVFSAAGVCATIYWYHFIFQKYFPLIRQYPVS